MNKSNVIIYVKENEAIERAVKRFKKKIEQIGVLKKLRTRKHYKKPSVLRREERLRAIYRQKMKLREGFV